MTAPRSSPPPPSPEQAPDGLARRTKALGVGALAVVLGLFLVAVLVSRGRQDAPVATSPSSSAGNPAGAAADAATEDTDAQSSVQGNDQQLDQDVPDTTLATASEYGDVLVVGEPLAPLQRTGTDSALGAAAPQLTGTSFDGSTVDVGPGSPTLLMFVAHWCPHCQREIPRLAEWVSARGGLGGTRLVVVATGTDGSRPNYPPSEWLRNAKLPAELLRDDQETTAGQAFGLTAFPFVVAVDADGNVRGRTSGELTAPQLDALLVAAEQRSAS